MANYRFIHPEQKKLILRMSQTLKPWEISEHTGISPRTIYRVLEKYRRTGQITTHQAILGRPKELGGQVLAYIEGLIEKKPDIFLSELQHEVSIAFNLDTDISTIQRALIRRGFSRKKVTRLGRERDEDRRARYQATIAAEYPPETLVFLDESHCNRHTSNRTYAWAPTGDRARRHDFFVRGTRYSILPAISLDGILHLDIITKSWNADKFVKFIECLLDSMNPYPQRNSVLVMDNASTHHFEGLREIVEARGMRLVYLPPYSPDFNPIEEGFSAMKAWIRRHRDWILGEMTGEEFCDPFELLYQAVHETMTPENISGWYRDSGYLA